jgi:hypothetical protein
MARQLGLGRKTVRKYLRQPSQGYRSRPSRTWKPDPNRSYLRERWEQGARNAVLHNCCITRTTPLGRPGLSANLPRVEIIAKNNATKSASEICGRLTSQEG